VSQLVSDVFQSLVFIRVIFNDGGVEEKHLETIPLHGKARGEDTFRKFCDAFPEMNVLSYS
jgi:hypothetical protein